MNIKQIIINLCCHNLGNTSSNVDVVLRITCPIMNKKY